MRDPGYSHGGPRRISSLVSWGQIDPRSGPLSPPVRSKDVEIPEPCHADWDAMRPEDRGRFCFECKTKVHDLSAMTEAEAERFLERTACEEVCISYRHAADGTIVFREPAPRPAPVVPLSRLRRPRKVAAAVAGVGMAAALAACAPHGEEPRIREAEEISFEAPAAVIPHGQAQEATPVPPSAEADDEPCDAIEGAPTSEPITMPETPRLRGKIKRTAGRPALPQRKGRRVPI